MNPPHYSPIDVTASYGVIDVRRGYVKPTNAMLPHPYLTMHEIIGFGRLMRKMPPGISLTG